MSSQRKVRAEKREAQDNPINFTCGECHQVHEYNEGYLCPDAPEDDKPEEEPI